MADKTNNYAFLAGEIVTSRKFQLTLGQGDLVSGTALLLNGVSGKLEVMAATTEEVFAVLVNDTADLASDGYVSVYVKGTFLGSGLTFGTGAWEDYFALARKNQLLFISK